jgi:hypothetical protein
LGLGIGNWVFGRLGLGLGIGVKDWDWDWELGIGFFDGLGSSSTYIKQSNYETSPPVVLLATMVS